MRVCVFGAGAVGGHVATRLVAACGDEVSVVTRGATLKAVRERGFLLHSGGKEIIAKPAIVTDDPFTLPPQDCVMVALKAHHLPIVASAVAHLIAPTGCALFLVNGIPWWWRYGLTVAPNTLPLLDPESSLWTQIRPERVLGGVVYSPNETIEPAVVRNSGRNYMIVGEPNGTSSKRLIEMVDLLRRGGFEVSASTDLRREIWRKSVRGTFASTLTALTRLDMGGICTDPGLHQVSVTMTHEILSCAAATGWDLREETDIEALVRSGKPGMRPSMLHDVLQGRPVEVEAQLGQIQEFARESHIAVPTIDVVLQLLRGLNRSLQSGGTG